MLSNIYDYLVSTGFPFSNICAVCICHTFEIVSVGPKVHTHKYCHLCIGNFVTKIIYNVNQDSCNGARLSGFTICRRFL